MLCNRLKQFREYNALEKEHIADVLGISLNLYEDFEYGRAVPTMDIIEKLAKCYKVTVDEFYGYTPRLTLYDKSMDLSDDEIDSRILKMSDLSWEEAQLILYYRNTDDKDPIIKQIIEKNTEKKP